MDITRVAQTQSQWLLVGVPLQRYFPNEDKAFRALRNMIMVFSFALTGSGTTSGIYKNLGGILRKKGKNRPTPADLSKAIAAIKKHTKKYWPTFEQKVRDLRYNPSGRNESLRRIFQFIEIELNQQYGIGVVRNLYDQYGSGLTLDHLQPTKISKFDPDIQHRLGNLCLLEKKANSGLLTTPYDDSKKQSVLRDSDYLATKSLVCGPDTAVGSYKKAYGTFKQRKTLSEPDVDTRTDELLVYLESRFI